jgi:hypothetical protein
VVLEEDCFAYLAYFELVAFVVAAYSPSSAKANPHFVAFAEKTAELLEERLAEAEKGDNFGC